jgi:pantoate--beta-alanine ligase
MPKCHILSLKDSREYLSEIRSNRETIGTIHTLGALHEGHGALIKQSATENKNTIVTIYPNKIQLVSGTKYKYDLDKDTEFAFKSGATAVISSSDEEMFPFNYITYIEQGLSQERLAGSVLPGIIKGMITGCIRWINFTQPTRSYFGLKDIEQLILVKRAVNDLFINTQIVQVPCVRFKNGVPISSRLMDLNTEVLIDVAVLYEIIMLSRKHIANGEKDATKIIHFIESELRKNLKYFSILLICITDTIDFSDIAVIQIPFIIRIGIKYGTIKHFDGQLITSEYELQNGNSVIWL